MPSARDSGRTSSSSTISRDVTHCDCSDSNVTSTHLDEVSSFEITPRENLMPDQRAHTCVPNVKPLCSSSQASDDRFFDGFFSGTSLSPASTAASSSSSSSAAAAAAAAATLLVSLATSLLPPFFFLGCWTAAAAVTPPWLSLADAAFSVQASAVPSTSVWRPSERSPLLFCDGALEATSASASKVREGLEEALEPGERSFSGTSPCRSHLRMCITVPLGS